MQCLLIITYTKVFYVFLFYQHNYLQREVVVTAFAELLYTLQGIHSHRVTHVLFLHNSYLTLTNIYFMFDYCSLSRLPDLMALFVALISRVVNIFVKSLKIYFHGYTKIHVFVFSVSIY